jgi:hypothetical protein
VLENYGIRYLVVEESDSESKALQWLREEVKSQRFSVVKEFTIVSNRSKFNNVPLVIYEYIEYKPYSEGKIFDIRIPLIRDSITIPFDKILKKNS